MGEIGDITQGDGGAGDTCDRHKQGAGIEIGQCVAIPGLQAPGEVHPDAGMHPDHQRQRELAGDAFPSADQQRPQHPGIAGFDAVEFMGQPRADDMDHAQRHDQDAEAPLQPLPVRQLQRAAVVERPQGEREVDQQGAVENGLAGGIVPDEDEPAAASFENAQRDQAEGVIKEMRNDIEEEDVARPEA